MQKVFYTFFSIVLLWHFIVSETAAAASRLPDLPQVEQDTNVHTLATTYCRLLWQSVNTPTTLGYDKTDSDIFREKFAKAVSEFEILLKKIADNKPIMIGDTIILHSDPITDTALLAVAEYFDASTHSVLKTALTNMRELGKHNEGLDFDNETLAHVNEIFVYAWNKVKENPSVRLPALLLGLVDAAPTCIQGYSVRMLCAVHPPKQKTKE
jgi:hypothetical protein